MRVLITGATGMIGSSVLQTHLRIAECTEIIVLTRRSTAMNDPKLTEVIIHDFLNLELDTNLLQNIDVVQYCLGSYTGTVPADLFRQINVDYPRVLAKALMNHNESIRFCLLSGQGADRTEKSRLQFAKDKGAIENILSSMDGVSLHSFRPGYIYPVEPRREPNFTYKLSRWLYPVLKLMGPKYSIPSTDLANAMVQVGMHGHSLEVLENQDIVCLS